MTAMIDTMIQKFLEASPQTVSLVVVVVIFIKYISRRDRSWETAHREELKDHLEAREASRAAILDNTKAMVRLIDKLENLSAVCPIGKIEKEVQITVKKTQ